MNAWRRPLIQPARGVHLGRCRVRCKDLEEVRFGPAAPCTARTLALGGFVAERPRHQDLDVAHLGVVQLKDDHCRAVDRVRIEVLDRPFQVLRDLINGETSRKVPSSRLRATARRNSSASNNSSVDAASASSARDAPCWLRTTLSRRS